jgi:hypothetical protein
MNIEYLKRCIYQLMITHDISEKSRLYPVISTILKFTDNEKLAVTNALNDEIASTPAAIVDSAWNNITGIASSSFGSLFGSSSNT